MKLKNINAFEQHFDKVILGLACVFLLYIIVAYLVMDQFGDGTTVDDRVLSTAKRLEGELSKPAPKVLTDFQVPNYGSMFAGKLEKPLTPPSPAPGVNSDVLAIANVTGYGPILSGVTHTNGTQRAYRPLEITKPIELLARADLATLDNPQDPQVIQAAGGRPPFDVQSVSVAARIDIAGILEQLEPRVADLDVQPIAAQWMREAFAIVDVQIERRHLSIDGSWSEPTLLDPMPGRPTFRGRLDGVTIQNGLQFVEAIRRQQADLVRPAGYLIKNALWEPPALSEPQPDIDDAAATGPNAQQIAQLTQQRQGMQRRLDGVQQQISNIRARNQQPPRQLLNQINELNSSISRIDFRIRQLQGGAATPPRRTPGRPGMSRLDDNFDGDDEFFEDIIPEFGPGAPAGRGQVPQPGAGAIEGGLLNQTTLDVWSQDLTVRPGQIYQYRVRIVTTNPLFGRRLPETQQELRDQFTITGEWSDWSEPVETFQLNYFWVIAGSLNEGYAKVEMWRYHDGLWKKGETNIYPGDPIRMPNATWEPLADAVPLAENIDLAPAGTVDFVTDYYVVDIDFRHKLLRQVGGIGLTQDTIQLLYTGDGNRFEARTADYDRDELERVKRNLLGDQVLSPEERRQRLQEAFAERARLRQEQRGTTTTRPDRRTPTPADEEYFEDIIPEFDN